jgi:hypothetical protein
MRDVVRQVYRQHLSETIPTDPESYLLDSPHASLYAPVLRRIWTESGANDIKRYADDVIDDNE